MNVLSYNENQKDQDIIRQVINKQRFDDLWNACTNITKQLTDKFLSDFQQLQNAEILATAIIVSIVETSFASLSSM